MNGFNKIHNDYQYNSIYFLYDYNYFCLNSVLKLSGLTQCFVTDRPLLDANY